MRQQWVALLSVLGLTGSGVRVQSQVIKGSTQPTTKQKPADPKLGLKQETLRQQNQGSAANGHLTPPPPGQAGKNASTGQNNALTKANNQQITKGNASNQQLTKGNLNLKQETLRQQHPGGVNSVNNTQVKAVGQNTGTCRYSEGCQPKNNQQITKGNVAGNQQLTKGNVSNQLLTKGNAANSQITKGNVANNQQITKGNVAQKNNQALTKGNQALTKGNQALTKGNQAVPK